MKEKLNTSLHTFSLMLVFALTFWYFIYGDVTSSYILTVMIIALVLIEAISLSITSKIYPESHTTFKIGIIAALLVLLGIKSMLPSFFVALAIAVFCINFLYNFYTINKRKNGGFKRKARTKLKF